MKTIIFCKTFGFKYEKYVILKLDFTHEIRIPKGREVALTTLVHHGGTFWSWGSKYVMDYLGNPMWLIAFGTKGQYFRPPFFRGGSKSHGFLK